MIIGGTLDERWSYPMAVVVVMWVGIIVIH